MALDDYPDWKEVAKLSEKEQMRAWVENWKRVGPELERLKQEELRAKTEKMAHQDAVILANSRADTAASPAIDEPESGLVAQQRIFQRFHARP